MRLALIFIMLLGAGQGFARSAHEYTDKELLAAGWSPEQVRQLRDSAAADAGVLADNTQIHIDSYCGYFTGDSPGSVFSFNPTNRMENVVEEVMSVTGLPRNFNVVAAGVPNASALIVRGKRVIAYNQNFLHNVEQRTGSKLSLIHI